MCCITGHVDAGKSTMMGHVLYQLGFVNKKVMHKHEQEAKKMGKASFAYAWVLDETEEERSVVGTCVGGSSLKNICVLINVHIRIMNLYLLCF